MARKFGERGLTCFPKIEHRRATPATYFAESVAWSGFWYLIFSGSVGMACTLSQIAFCTSLVGTGAGWIKNGSYS